MFIPPSMLEVIHKQRVEDLRRDYQEGLWFSQHPTILMPVRLWIAERLIGLGKWLKAQGAGSPEPTAMDTTLATH